MKKQAAPSDVDAYLAAVPEPARTTLQKMRRVIKQTAPKAEEMISYGVPTYHYHYMLVCIGAFKNHCSLFGASRIKFKDELKDYKVSAGTIQFPMDKPMPATLLKKIVMERMRENEERAMMRDAKKKKAPAKTAAKKKTATKKK